MSIKRHCTVKKIGAILARRDGGWYCHYCMCEIHPEPEMVDSVWKPRKATVDHKIPLSRGGTDNQRNSVLACKQCNDEKGDGDYAVFFMKVRRRLRRRERLERKYA